MTALTRLLKHVHDGLHRSAVDHRHSRLRRMDIGTMLIRHLWKSHGVNPKAVIR